MISFILIYFDVKNNFTIIQCHEKKKSGKIGTINLFKQKFRVFIHGDRF